METRRVQVFLKQRLHLVNYSCVLKRRLKQEGWRMSASRAPSPSSLFCFFPSSSMLFQNSAPRPANALLALALLPGVRLQHSPVKLSPPPSLFFFPKIAQVPMERAKPDSGAQGVRAERSSPAVWSRYPRATLHGLSQWPTAGA